MGLATVLRFLLGALFVCSGTIKITRFGHAVLPDTHKQMAKEFGKFLKVAPFKGHIKITSVQYMHAVGYTELIAGALLLMNSNTMIASLVLSAVMCGASYTHYRLKDSPRVVAFPGFLMLACLYVGFCGRSGRKEKSD